VEDLGRQLIRDLLSDPRRFEEDGRAYELLQAYFEGLPLETLRPLLQHQDEHVQRAAVFIASELGIEAYDLVQDVIPLLHTGNRYLQYNAMEVLAVCGEDDQATAFAHVVTMLESEDNVLRGLAMRLISRADSSQLDASRQFFEKQYPGQRAHLQGLDALVAGNGVDPALIIEMIRGVDPLLRRYGAIAAKRLVQQFPYLITEMVSSNDPDLVEFRETLTRNINN
jgi:hypothetical protein